MPPPPPPPISIPLVAKLDLVAILPEVPWGSSTAIPVLTSMYSPAGILYLHTVVASRPADPSVPFVGAVAISCRTLTLMSGYPHVIHFFKVSNPDREHISTRTRTTAAMTIKQIQPVPPSDATAGVSSESISSADAEIIDVDARLNEVAQQCYLELFRHAICHQKFSRLVV